MRRLIFTTIFLVTSLLRVGAAEPMLKIVSTEATVAFTAEEFAALPRAEATVVEPRENSQQHYSGVAVRELLTRAGVPMGEKFRGAALGLAVVVHCKDGYTVLFSLAEFQEGFSSRTIVLADRADGDILPPSAAPLRIIVPGDKRPARSARQVTSLEIVSLGKP